MLFGENRNELRRMYGDAFRKARDNAVLSPLEAQIAAVVDDHPEYHELLGNEPLEREFTPGAGETNPFLHMGLHLALRDQIETDRPPGIAALYARFAPRCRDRHEAEHRLIECLAETLWEAQAKNEAPDEERYLERVRTLVG